MQLPAPPPSAALPGKPRRGSGVGIEGAAWGRLHSLVLGRGPHGGGGGSPGPLPVPQPTLIPTPNDCPKLEVFLACILSPRPILRLPPTLFVCLLPGSVGVYLYISVSISFSACL